MSLKRQRAETLPATLTIKGQGETSVFDVTYHNRKLSQLQAKLEEAEDASDAVLFIVKDWDSEYPLSKEGILEMEDDMPGITLALTAGFHEARMVHKVKN